MKYCQACGGQLSAAANFCGKCGASQDFYPAEEKENSAEKGLAAETTPIFESAQDKAAIIANTDKTNSTQSIADGFTEQNSSYKKRAVQYCSKCGEENNTDARYCNSCGASHNNSGNTININIQEIQRRVPEMLSYSSPDEWKSLYADEFNHRYPHLAGCVPASFSTRWLRGMIWWVGPFIFNQITNLISSIFTSKETYMGVTISTGINGFGVLLIFIITVLFFYFQYFALTRNGMNYPDYFTKTKYLDFTSGSVITKRSILLQTFAYDLGPFIVTLLSILVVLLSILSSAFAVLANLVSSFSTVYNLLWFAGGIVATVQMYTDKVSHRCWIDKFVNIIVIDTKRGKDPIPYYPIFNK